MRRQPSTPFAILGVKRSRVQIPAARQEKSSWKRLAEDGEANLASPLFAEGSLAQDAMCCGDIDLLRLSTDGKNDMGIRLH